MIDLTERQRLTLALVIRDYIETAQPVGSMHLVEHYGLDVSSATLRNEMVSLTEMGYLRQPHTSADRVPTEEGYRYFVRQLMGHTELHRPSGRKSGGIRPLGGGTEGMAGVQGGVGGLQRRRASAFAGRGTSRGFGPAPRQAQGRPGAPSQRPARRSGAAASITSPSHPCRSMRRRRHNATGS